MAGYVLFYLERKRLKTHQSKFGYADLLFLTVVTALAAVFSLGEVVLKDGTSYTVLRFHLQLGMSVTSYLWNLLTLLSPLYRQYTCKVERRSGGEEAGAGL